MVCTLVEAPSEKSEPEPVELEDIIKQIHNIAFYEGNSHVIGVRDVLTIFRNYLKSKRGVPKQEPLSDEAIDLYCKNKNIKALERLRFYHGVLFAEQEHGIGVSDDKTRPI